MAEDQYRRLSCGSCAVSFTVSAGKRGRPPKWCSDACGKGQASPSGAAPQMCLCGAPARPWAGKGRRKLYCGSKRCAAEAKPPMHLSCTACGAEFLVERVRGRPPTKCESCRAGPEPAAQENKQCPACRGFFLSTRETQTCCSRACGWLHRARLRRGTVAPIERECANCGKRYMPRQSAGMYCSVKCKKTLWAKENPEKANPPSLPFSTYVARFCDRCEQPSAKRNGWTTCTACIRKEQSTRARAANRASYEAIHRAAAKEVCCDECGARYCPIYGCAEWRANGPVPLCQVCKPARKKQSDRAAKAKRSAAKRGAGRIERIDPIRVFERDGWKCQMCGEDTPQGLRGTCEPRAPEMDHLVALALGGSHTWDNVACLCRECNGRKSDLPLDEAIELICGAVDADRSAVTDP